jgi:hypothetical protein
MKRQCFLHKPGDEELTLSLHLLACPEHITSLSPGLSRKHYLFIYWLVQKTLPLHLLACPENIISSSPGLSRKHYLFISWLVQKALSLHLMGVLDKPGDEEIMFSGQARR